METIAFNKNQAYKGKYYILVQDNRIVKVIPPSGYEVLARLSSLDTWYQEIFVNKDQDQIFNRLALNPIYSQGFTRSKGPEKGRILIRLVKEIPIKTFQWSLTNRNQFL